MYTQIKTRVDGAEEIENTYFKKRGWFLIFPVTSWEVVSSNNIGNDIHIETNREIRDIYLNGKKINFK